MIFLLFDTFVKNSKLPLPNGFNMSVEEFDAHRLNTDAHKSITMFSLPASSEQNHDVIPLSSAGFFYNPEFFLAHGTAKYVINLSKIITDYTFLFQTNINSWINFLDPRVVQAVRSGKVKLVLQSFVEPASILDVERMLLCAEQVLGSLENFEYHTCFNAPRVPELQWWHAKSFAQCIHYAPFYEQFTVQHETENLLEQPRDKFYISLCRRYNKERLITHAFLLKNDLLSLGYNSIPACDVNSPEQADLKTSLLKTQSDTRGFYHELEHAVTYYSSNRAGLSLDKVEVLSTNQENNHSVMGFHGQRDLEPFFKRSYLSLVQEGDIEDYWYITTEKTFRAIFYKHLFVIIGNPHSLAHLRSLGYKTFDTLWDESYDKIHDSSARIRYALNTFHSIITENDVAALYEQARPILEHNYQHLLRTARTQHD